MNKNLSSRMLQITSVAPVLPL